MLLASLECGSNTVKRDSNGARVVCNILWTVSSWSEFDLSWMERKKAYMDSTSLNSRAIVRVLPTSAESSAASIGCDRNHLAFVTYILDKRHY